MDAIDRIGQFPRDLHPHPVLPQPVDGGGEGSGQPLDEDDDGVRPRRRRQPHLMLDEDTTGERQRGAQLLAGVGARCLRRAAGEYQCGQRHSHALMPQR